MKNKLDFMDLIRRSRAGGSIAEEMSYNFDKMMIDLTEGKLRNYKVVQGVGGLFIKNG